MLAIIITVNINNDGIKKSMYVHRLMAYTFLYHTSDISEVNHFDKNPTNNILEKIIGFKIMVEKSYQ